MVATDEKALERCTAALKATGDRAMASMPTRAGMLPADHRGKLAGQGLLGYQVPLLAMDSHGSRGGSAAPFCSSSIEI